MVMLLLSVLMWAQSNSPTLPSPLPLPAAVKEVKPVTPQRIHVGSQVQQGYSGPAGFWFHCCGNTLSEDHLAQLEQTLISHAEDICARGQLIANSFPTPRAGRIENLLWIIEHKPEWDGFFLSPRYSLMLTSPEREPGGYDRLRDAWLRQVGPDQRSGTALHNAAMFFAISEPDFAASLLDRAIRLEPEVPFYVERLGVIYALAQFSESDLGVRDFADTATRRAFAQRTQKILLASNDWILVGGAVKALQGQMGFDMPSTRELGPLLAKRLTMLTGAESTFTSLNKLPSTHYRGTQCDAMFAHP